MTRRIKYALATVVVTIAQVLGMILFDYDMIDEWADDET